MECTGQEGIFLLLEVKNGNTDVSGGVRTPPLIQPIHTYVCTHGHRTRHDPLRRAAGRPGTHDIAHEHMAQEAEGSALQTAEGREIRCWK